MDYIIYRRAVGVQDDFGNQEAEESESRAKDQMVEIEETVVRSSGRR